VVVNLLNNAVDAVNQRAAGERDDFRGRVPIRSRRTGDQVEVVVEDNGTGVPAALRSRVFEPFFTTKDVGAGTGLGLATVYGAAEQNGGAVRIESEPGKGTRLHVYLRTVPT
jgi:two-component system cell cycle sensor histidine kinase/response regulator CckA